MKKILTLLILLSFYAVSKAQYVDIPDPVLKTKLMALYPGCFNAGGQMDTSCSAITTAISLDLHGPSSMTDPRIRTCDALRYFHSLQTLDISSNSLGLDGPLVIPESLVSLKCATQLSTDFYDPYTLHSLPELPATLQYLDCNNNGLTALPQLPTGLTWLDCSYQTSKVVSVGYIHSLPALSSPLPASLIYLSCRFNALTSLPSLPNALEYLDCSYNKADIGTFHVPGISVLPTLPTSLIDLTIAQNNISELPSLPSTLAFLDCSVNPISCLPALPASLGGQSTYNNYPQNLILYSTNITCLPNDVPGVRIGSLTTVSVCSAGNNLNGCGINSPFIGVSQSVLNGFVDVQGSASYSQWYKLSAHDLVPASGNLTLTPSVGVEVSLDNSNFSASPINIPYTNGNVPATFIYVRFGNNVFHGPVTGTVTQSGGGAANAVVTLNGYVVLVQPSISIIPGTVNNLYATFGSFSNSVPVTVSAYDLDPTSGNMTVSVLSSYLEISQDNINFSSSPILLPFVSGTLTSTIYVRLNNTAPVYPSANYGGIHFSGGNVFTTISAIGTVDNPVTGINAAPGLSLTGSVGTPSNAATYVLSANNLLFPDAGNLTLTASSFLELSLDNINFSAGSISVPYTTGQLAARFIYVRLAATAPQGTYNGTVINSGGSSPDVSVSVHCVVTGPVITATPNITGLVASVGTASNAGSYHVSGAGMVSNGSLTITASNFIELSTDNINFSLPPLLVPYTGNTLSSTTIYARISSNAPIGLFSGTITNSGQNAVDKIITVSGIVSNHYYNTKANLGLTNPGTWSSTLDGTGPSPLTLNDTYQVFHIVNEVNSGYSGTWDVSALNSKIVVGDGVNPLNFTILPGVDSISSATKIDISANATLRILNNRIPALNNLAVGSTVDFAQAGTTAADTIWIPRRKDYYNLKLTNGLKYFSKNVPATQATLLVTEIKNNLTIDGVVSINGSSEDWHSTVVCSGNVDFLNGAAFEPEATGVPGRFDLVLVSDQVPIQYVNTNGTDLYFSQFVVSTNTILSANSNVNVSLNMRISSWVDLTTTGGNINFIHRATPAFSGPVHSNGTSFNISRDIFGWWQVSTLNFAPGSTINNFIINSTTAPDTLQIVGDVDVTTNLVLTNGLVKVSPGSTLHLTATGNLTGGSSNSFIEGAFSRTGTTSFTFPVGNCYWHKYAPVDFSNYAGANDTYTVQYITGQPISTVDPLTLALFPDYHVSGKEYWLVAPTTAGSSVDLNFHYTDALSQVFLPNQLRIAHFDGADWNDLGGIPGAGNTLTSGNVFVSAVSQFSPFTFAGTTSLVVPVKLSSFTATKQDKTVKLNWTTEQEINSKSFIVERSPDQRNWNEITRLNAAGNSNVRLNYTAADYNPAKGINYYRLRSLDADGKFSYSVIRPVYFGDNGAVVIAPNPASDKTTIYLPGNTAIVSIQIFNVNGQLIKTVSTAGEFVQIDVSNFSKGIYTVKLSSKNMNEAKRLVVE